MAACIYGIYIFFFLKHLSGPESWILEFDWANQALVKDKLLKQKSKPVKFYNQNTKELPLCRQEKSSE